MKTAGLLMWAKTPKENKLIRILLKVKVDVAGLRD
jgi:hypothetical protein